jgi:hypothetical protein
MLRTLTGAPIKVVLPGTEFEVYSEPFLIPGHSEYKTRLLVNKATETNILADRLVKPSKDLFVVAGKALLKVWAGKNKSDFTTMLAIGAAESAQFTLDKGDASINYPRYARYSCNNYLSFGWWQCFAGVHFQKYINFTGSVNPCDWYEWAKNPENAARIAELIFRGSGLNAWSTYKNGAYLRYMPKAIETTEKIFPVVTNVVVFDAPIGTPEERASSQVWPGNWRSAWHPLTGFMKKYTDSARNVSYHTGDDLNLNLPTWNSDAHSPVYASGDGIVMFSGRVGNYWRNIITIQHQDLEDGPVFTRYAHVENMLVKTGDQVVRGQQIAQVGMSGGPGSNYHLHFDVSRTRALESPGHWPGTNLNGVRINYVDPLTFIRNHRP